MKPSDLDKPTQSLHIGGKNGKPLLSVFVWADDTFQVDEGGRVVLTTHAHAAPKARQATLLARCDHDWGMGDPMDVEVCRKCQAERRNPNSASEEEEAEVEA